MYRHMKYNCKIKKEEERNPIKILERISKLEIENKKFSQLKTENKG